MKKLLTLGAIALFGAMNAQTTGNFKLGAHVGLPTGDFGDLFSVNAGVDVAYVWRVAPNFDLGVTTGYSHYFGKEIKGNIMGYSYSEKVEDAGAIPVAATAQYNFSEGFFIGADLGYAFITNEGAEGGFLYQPKIGYTFKGKNDIYLGYKGISNDGTISSVNLGYAYKF